MPEELLNPEEVLGIRREQLPRHIAIIMDGNGRWASERGVPRLKGHAAGAKVVRSIVTECARLGLEALTLYSFSSENWKRPKDEIDFLMELYAYYLVAEREEILENNIKFHQVGRREGLPDSVLAELDTTAELSKDNTGLNLCLALNYGARGEIVDAVRSLATEFRGVPCRGGLLARLHRGAPTPSHQRIRSPRSPIRRAPRGMKLMTK